MLFLEYNWTAGVFAFRIGESFTDFRGVRSWPTLADAIDAFAAAGMKLGRKTDSRTWPVIMAAES